MRPGNIVGAAACRDAQVATTADVVVVLARAAFAVDFLRWVHAAVRGAGVVNVHERNVLLLMEKAKLFVKPQGLQLEDKSLWRPPSSM